MQAPGAGGRFTRHEEVQQRGWISCARCMRGASVQQAVICSCVTSCMFTQFLAPGCDWLPQLSAQLLEHTVAHLPLTPWKV